MAQPQVGVPGTYQAILTADQIQRRVADIARQIAADYAGRTLYIVGVLEDGFIFVSDLVRHLEMPVVCLFVKAATQEAAGTKVTEIVYSPEVDVKGADVLLIQGLLDSGVTTEFLSRNLVVRGAQSVKICALLDRQAGRRVMLQPDYFGFLLDEKYVFGYGLGAPNLGRNLPFIATTQQASSRSNGK